MPYPDVRSLELQCSQYRNRNFENECGDLIVRHPTSGYSKVTVVWDAETLELVGSEYCSDDAGEFGECGACRTWGSVEYDPESCIPRDPCAKRLPKPTGHQPCQVPVDDGGFLIPDATGVCAAEGSCSEDRDCLNSQNHFSPNCARGLDRCEAGQCVDPTWPNCE